MKLLIAVINNDDCPSVLSEISKNGYTATKLSTSGGFLRAGNSTLLIGVEEERVDSLIEIIGKFCSKRKEIIQANTSFNSEFFTSFPVEVSVGGATIFVIDLDRFVKL